VRVRVCVCVCLCVSVCVCLMPGTIIAAELTECTQSMVSATQHLTLNIWQKVSQADLKAQNKSYAVMHTYRYDTVIHTHLYDTSFCLPVKEFYGTPYQSGLLFLNFMWGVVFTACVVFCFSFSFLRHCYSHTSLWHCYLHTSL